jgi:peptidoglycan glycosyltransferase
MNRQIRQLGFVLVVLFIILFVQLNNVQVLQASKLQNDPRNNRNTVKDFSSPRGDILSADGTILAQSVPSNDQYDLQRTYPEGELFGHLTGFFSFNYGSEGLEREYNDELAGHEKSISHFTDLLTDKVTTEDVTITVTKKMQQVAKDALGDKHGAVVALNPKTGDILAMYSNPSYDPNALSTHDFTKAKSQRTALIADKSKPMLPRTYREAYPPGSTFKTVTASAAYEKRPDLTKKSYPGVSSITPPLTNRPLSNFGGEVCGGQLPQLYKISCNTGFAAMGIDLGAQNMFDAAQSFGFNQVPPLDEPSVAKSTFPQVSFFNRNTPQLAYSSIGQGNTTATPLQMAMVAGAIANDGVIVKPHLLKEVRDSDGNVVKAAKPEEWMRAVSSDTADKMRDNMLGVVNGGTGTAARIPNVQVAGKTGTAETHDGLIDTWFICFAPANDPQIAIAVVVEDQANHGESTGGVVSAPIAKKVMQAALGLS